MSLVSSTIDVKIDTAILNKIKAALEAEANKSVQYGWFNTSDHPDKLRQSKQFSTVAGVAWRNEFGVERGGDEYGVPPRPFIRPTIAYNREWQINALKRIAKHTILLKGDTSSRRKALGKYMSNQLKQSIDNSRFYGKSDNSEFIASRKGFNKPLAGKTGILKNSLTYKLQNHGID